MAFELPPLPYDKGALAPHMSAETLEFHHGKHHKAYVDKTNGFIVEKGLEGRKLSEVIAHAKQAGDKGLFNNSAQIWNHSFFWQCLTPDSQAPTGKLASLIDAAFGSHEELVKKLSAEAVGHFGSGWAWLVLAGDALKITSLHDGETPLGEESFKPLLTLDLWEHAYYIDYRNLRPSYADRILKEAINWDFAAQNLDGEGASRADQPA